MRASVDVHAHTTNTITKNAAIQRCAEVGIRSGDARYMDE
jgi:hypothetical protein